MPGGHTFLLVLHGTFPGDPSGRIRRRRGGDDRLVLPRAQADPGAFLVVLHIPAHSDSQLDRVLAGATSLPVSVPKDGQSIRPGHVYVATPDRHLMVDGHRIRLTRGPKECRVRPAIDVLFRSMALAFGPWAAGVVLSGTMDDGTAGLWSLKEHGGHAFVQDPAEARHPGMPQSALDHIAVDVHCAGGQIGEGTRGLERTGDRQASSIDNGLWQPSGPSKSACCWCANKPASHGPGEPSPRPRSTRRRQAGWKRP